MCRSILCTIRGDFSLRLWRLLIRCTRGEESRVLPMKKFAGDSHWQFFNKLMLLAYHVWERFWEGWERAKEIRRIGETFTTSLGSIKFLYALIITFQILPLKFYVFYRLILCVTLRMVIINSGLTSFFFCSLVKKWYEGFVGAAFVWKVRLLVSMTRITRPLRSPSMAKHSTFRPETSKNVKNGFAVLRTPSFVTPMAAIVHPLR